MALEINDIAVAIFIASTEKMVEADFIQWSGRCERGNVPADAADFAIRANDHRHCIPANNTFDSPFDFAVAWKRRLILRRNRVDIWSICRKWKHNPMFLDVR